MSIFEAASQLAELPKPERLARAWQLLTQVQSPSDFAIALDFAIDEDLVDSDFAPHLRGDPEPEIPQRYWINPIDGSEMVWIPPGEFLIGENLRNVEAQGFFLARYPVTNEQFLRYLEERIKVVQNQSQVQPLLQQVSAGISRHPVTHVSYLDALGYCRWAGLHLPSEWLWEKAARGSDGRIYPWGDAPPYVIQWTRQGSFASKRLAQVRETAICAVEKFTEIRTPYGCEQLVGNISEWCTPDDELLTMPNTPTARQIVHVLISDQAQAAVRGSCYKRRSPSLMPSAHRRRLSVNRRNDWVGFRPAYYPPQHRVEVDLEPHM